MRSITPVHAFILLLGAMTVSCEAQSLAQKYLDEGIKESSHYFETKLANHRIASSREKDVTVWVTVLVRGTSNITTDFKVNDHGVQTIFNGGIRHGHTMGECQLTEGELRKLNALLLALPPSEPLKPTSRVIVSFFDRGKWTTRIYDGLAGRSELKALLDFPKFWNPSISLGDEL